MVDVTTDVTAYANDHPEISEELHEARQNVTSSAERDLRSLAPQVLRELRALDYAPRRCVLQGRPLEVAQLVALGLADKEIAHILAVSQGTAKGHVSMILRRLGLYRRTQICRYIHEAGLLP